MHSILDRLNTDHANLERLLRVVEEQLGVLREGARPDYRLLIDILDYVGTYADELHHPTEDRLFRALRAVAPAAAATADALMAEHHTLKEATGAFSDALHRVMDEHVMPREELESLGREFIEMQKHHVQREEQEVFPLIDGHLRPADWRRLEAELPDLDDPLFGDRINERYERLYHAIALAAD